MDSRDTPIGNRSISLSRRDLVSAILAGGLAGGVLSPVSGYLRGFAPLSGTVWGAAGDDRIRSLSSPYGAATVRFDEEGVPHVDAGSEPAAYYAVGYTQAADRLFQLDLQRRVMRGRLSEVVGPDTLESDKFNVRMGYLDAARANWTRLRDEPVGEAVAAFADGVNARIDDGPLPMEFGLLDYEPDPWTPVDTMLMEKQISWGLTGSFRTLRLALLEDQFGPDVVEELYPSRIPHDAPILRAEGGSSPGRTVVSRSADATTVGRSSGALSGLSIGEVSRLSRFESPPGVGSNSWVVSGDHTDSGQPIVANDPHLDLSVPPLWYEQHVETPDASVRGVTFPGVPFVIIGANHAGAWGFTNAGADVIDFYTYEVDDDGDRYRYRGVWREFDRKRRQIPVDGDQDRTIEVKRTVHGPMIDREGRSVAVAWTGLAATRTTMAVFEYARSDGLEEFLEATRRFDLPTQCLVYADRDGRTLFQVTGKVPIRRTDGEPVRGDRVFDGSAGEGEWDGFEPYGQPTWDGFVPFEEMPAEIDPPYLGTANQRVIDDDRYPHYFAASYADGYRGRRVWDLLDERVEGGPPVDREFLRSMQLDVRDYRFDDADFLVPALTDAEAPDRLENVGETLFEWDGRMDRDSRGALLFAAWVDAYREVVFEPLFSDLDLGEAYYPGDWTLLNAGPESTLFEERERAELAREAMERALEGIDGDSPRFEGADRYGDATHTGVLEHPFGVGALGYPRYETDGSPRTLMNFRPARPAGSSWRMLCEPGGDCEAILPGGNSGNYFSPHYDDQLRRWADGEYKSMDRELQGDLRFRFTKDGGGGDDE
ncbi:penicillin acylase family protein [Halalkaliarchaeum sp. AArc-GB]|uniref:penicillin acylase family protein n=1 Tax=Halalkaliarchaeum sp. AArc-GB TaxID=3074078 RepID=UPI002867A514|nr:penicillin acylase family protein [Halalkaliarchaeum sp. AArc-GB]MDR5672873.1 penicillin acylase family protein [Halalkaliarchaeum sp. AArc-GB]